MKVTIDKSMTSKNASKIIENVDDLENYLKRLEEVISNINTAWNSVESLKYVNNMKDTYIGDTKLLLNKLRKYGEYLDNIPKTYDLLDETFSNKSIDV